MDRLRYLRQNIKTILDFDEHSNEAIVQHLFTLKDFAEPKLYLTELLGIEKVADIDVFVSCFEIECNVSTSSVDSKPDASKKSKEKSKSDRKNDNPSFVSNNANSYGSNKNGTKKNEKNEKKINVRQAMQMKKEILQEQESLKSAPSVSDPMCSDDYVVCGCMSTRHKFIGSCIGCGRIICEKEIACILSKECPSCGDLRCFPPLTSNEMLKTEAIFSFDKGKYSTDQLSKAYFQKDRLLQYDREHAKRTHVHDAQEDYYETTTWLDEKDKKRIDKKQEQKKRAALPSNRKYKMTIDLAGRRVMSEVNTEPDFDSEEEEEEEEEEEKMEGERKPKVNISLEKEKDKEGTSDVKSTNNTFENASLVKNGNKIGDVYRLLRQIK